ncbi:MAG: hypothetical protein ACLFUR_05695 [Candidatus Hadarchaeia archaeon]
MADSKNMCDHCGEQRAVLQLCKSCTDQIVSKAKEGKKEESEEERKQERKRGSPCERCNDNPAIMGLCQSCINDLASSTLRPEKEVRKRLEKSQNKKENLDVRSNIMRKTAIQREIETLKWILGEGGESE